MKDRLYTHLEAWKDDSGQVKMKIAEMSDILQTTTATVKGLLRQLELEGKITKQTVNSQRIITIINYEKKNDSRTDAGQPAEATGQEQDKSQEAETGQPEKRNNRPRIFGRWG